MAYGLAGVAITRGKRTARGDNGVFLSIVMTGLVSGGLWLGWGRAGLSDLQGASGLGTVGLFALAGILSNVLGRSLLYRSTERIGPVRTGLLRRLTPLFALPCAFLLLGELPDGPTLAGGALVIAAVLLYMRWPAGAQETTPGAWLGVGSAMAYALAYSVRSLGLETVPDAMLGTFTGAVAGGAFILTATMGRKGPGPGLRYLCADRRGAHLLTALALSAGQLLQFFALTSATVVSVAALGTLEVLFSALLIRLFFKGEAIAFARLLTASALAAAGTVLLVL